MKRNDSPRNVNKLYDIMKDIINNRSCLDNYTNEFLDSLITEDESLSLNIYINENKFYYRGYPCGNYLKLFCKILELWHNHGSFPINFVKVEGLKDQTIKIIDHLNNQASTINFIFNFLKDNNIQGTYKLIVNFLEAIGMRGFMTILGVRTTPGSFESKLPKKDDLFKSFNAIYKREENEKDKSKFKKDVDNRKYVTKITVGARALSKHSDRTKDTFWGNITGSELERNARANQIFNKLISECVWINIHNLSHTTKILEIRNSFGYGIRWSADGEFRGLIEPEENKDYKYIQKLGKNS